MERLTSQGPSDSEQGQPFVYDGIQYGPEGLDKNQWRVDQAGLQALADAGRLWSNARAGRSTARVDQLRLKVYREEMLGRRLNNLWPENIARSRQALRGADRSEGDRALPAHDHPAGRSGP